MPRSPFSSFPTADADPRPRGPSPARIWTGRVINSLRDSRGRLQFLFDVVPLNGWPAVSEAVSSSQGAGLRCVPRVRMLQPFVGNLRIEGRSPTGLIVVPEVGSIVSVAPDDSGWVIIGFHSGPILANDGSSGILSEFSYNPGFEESDSRLSSDVSVPWLLGIEEGDIVLGKGNARIKMRGEGTFIGSGVNCLHVYKTARGEMLERYLEMERRATGRMSYHRFLPGVNPVIVSSVPQAPSLDAMVINTDIIEAGPYYAGNKPYVIRQVGHITRSTVALGRNAGEVLPLPTEVSRETALERHAVVRETVVKPSAAPNGSSADAVEMSTTSAPVFDYQVGADGSFHLRGGNIGQLPGASHLHEASKLACEISFDAKSNVFKIGVGQAGSELVVFELNGSTGSVTLEAKSVLKLKAAQVVIESDVATELTSQGLTTVKSTVGCVVDAPNFQADLAGLVTALTNFATSKGQSFVAHTHMYTDDGAPQTTAPPK